MRTMFLKFSKKLSDEQIAKAKEVIAKKVEENPEFEKCWVNVTPGVKVFPSGEEKEIIVVNFYKRVYHVSIID